MQLDMKKKSLRILILENLGPIIQSFRIMLHRYKGYKNIDKKVTLERNLNLDKVAPDQIHIGKDTLIASDVTILCHEHSFRDPDNHELPLVEPVYIGCNCFIGVGATILPGVKIGDHCIIGASSVVTKDIPSGSIAVGNPARVIRSGLVLEKKGIFLPDKN